MRGEEKQRNRSRGRTQLEARGPRNAAATAEQDEDVATPLHGTSHGDLEAVAVPLDPRAAVARPAPGQRVRAVDPIDAVAGDGPVRAEF